MSAAAAPLAGRVVPEVNDETVREVFLRRYRIIYGVRDAYILVFTVFRGDRRCAAIGFKTTGNRSLNLRTGISSKSNQVRGRPLSMRRRRAHACKDLPGSPALLCSLCESTHQRYRLSGR